MRTVTRTSLKRENELLRGELEIAREHLHELCGPPCTACGHCCVIPDGDKLKALRAHESVTANILRETATGWGWHPKAPKGRFAETRRNDIFLENFGGLESVSIPPRNIFKRIDSDRGTASDRDIITVLAKRKGLL